MDTILGDTLSLITQCLSVVHQGSVLGPILFFLCIARVGRVINDYAIADQQYADDATLHHPRSKQGEPL